ncbi:MAG: hypothetical protein AB7I19_05655 [Planctomycetota bacterium]
MPLAAPTSPDLIHYLPIATTGLSIAFLVVLLRRGRLRSFPPHLTWWAIGVLFYGVGTAIESVITLWGNSPLLLRAWYVAGALLGGYPLGTGSAYLLCRRRTAHALTAISGSIVLALSVATALSPVVAANLESHRPTGAALGWTWIRACTPLVNLYAAVFLIGGAIGSALRFAFPTNSAARDGRRAMGTALIAMGGLLPGIGGGLAKSGMVEALYVGEFLGLVMIWIGHGICASVPPTSPRLTPRGAGADAPPPPPRSHGTVDEAPAASS